MKGRGPLFLLLLALTVAIPGEAAPRTTLYRHPTCGYSFRHRADWSVMLVGDSNPCAVFVRPPNYATQMADDDVDVHTLTVDSGSGGFAKGAQGAGFVDGALAAEAYKRPDLRHKWVYLGAHGFSVARPLRKGSLRGLVAEGIETRTYHARGGFAGGGEAKAAFLTNGRKWVSIIANGTRPGEVFGSIVRSVRIARAARASR
jgi:hypothetical protein